MSQREQNREGNYYVTCLNGKYYRFLGPFPNNHRAALDAVDAVRKKAEEIDPRCAFLAFGTCRTELSDDAPGSMNDIFS